MKVTKTFVRNGRRYKPGEHITDELDTETVNHYKRLGMVEAGETGTVIAGTTARLAPNTPQRVSTRSRNTLGNTQGVKIPGTPESSLEVKSPAGAGAAGLPGPTETQQPKPGEQPQTGPEEKPQTGPNETGLPPGPQGAAAPPPSLPLGPVDATA